MTCRYIGLVQYFYSVYSQMILLMLQYALLLFYQYLCILIKLEINYIVTCRLRVQMLCCVYLFSVINKVNQTGTVVPTYARVKTRFTFIFCLFCYCYRTNQFVVIVVTPCSAALYYQHFTLHLAPNVPPYVSGRGCLITSHGVSSILAAGRIKESSLYTFSFPCQAMANQQIVSLPSLMSRLLPY